MKKLLLLGVLAASLFVGGKVEAKTLYQCFQEKEIKWSSVKTRAPLAAENGIFFYRGTAAQNEQLTKTLCNNLLGYSVATGYQKALSASMNTTQDYIPVSALTLKDGSVLTIANLGGKVFLDIEPGGNKEEIVMCAGINSSTVRFTGCTRGLAFSGTSTASVSANQKTHNAGSIIVMSNVHYVYEQFVDVNVKDQTLQGNKTVTGTWTFSVSLPRATTSTPTLPSELITLDYLTSVTTTGCGNASSSTRGCVQESTTSTNFLGTQVGSTGARNFVSVLSLTTSSDYATKAGTIPVLRADSQLDASFGGNPGSLATLDANQKVVQNPASATSTPGVTSTIVMTSSTTGRINPGYVGTSTINGQILRSTSTGAYWGGVTTQITTTSPSSMDKTASKSSGVAYFNSSTVAFFVTVEFAVYNDNDSSASMTFFLDTTSTAMYQLGLFTLSGAQATADSKQEAFSFIVPPGWYYKVTGVTGGAAGGVASISRWTEVLY